MELEKFSGRLKAEGKPELAQGVCRKGRHAFCFAASESPTAGDIFLAAYLGRQKRIRECLEVMEHAAEKGPPENLQIPRWPMIRSNAADAAQYAQLEKLLVAAADRSKHSVGLMLVLAELHAQQKEYAKSIADYREVLAKEPRNYQALNNLGLSLARAGQNLDEALKLINDSLNISGPMAEVLDSRAIVHIARQEPEKALEDMAAAIKDDGSAEQYFHQAWAYSLAGKKTEASAALAAAKGKGLDPMKLDPHEVPVYDRLKDAM